jgi:hypothetical protein
LLGNVAFIPYSLLILPTVGTITLGMGMTILLLEAVLAIEPLWQRYIFLAMMWGILIPFTCLLAFVLLSGISLFPGSIVWSVLDLSSAM